MPDFPFLLTYADVPFISDVARSFTMKQPVPEQEDAVTTPPKKHQSNADLIDEVNRLISLKILNDFDSSSDYLGRSVSAVAQLGNAQTWPNASIPVGTFYHPTNAKRFGVFRGLATSSMVKAMLAVTQGVSPATFTMKQPPLIGTFQNTDSYTISTDLYMLPPRPLAEHGAGFNGLFLVTLVDERYYWSNPASLRVTHNSTWESLLTAIAAVLNITLSIPAIPTAYGRPEPDSQLWCTGQNAAVLFDAIAFNIGCTVVRNLDGSYSLLNGAASRTIVDTNRGNAHSVVRMAGGDIFYSGTKLPTGNLQPSRNSVVPSAIVTHFPKYIQGDDPVPHFNNLRNTPQRPSSWFEDSFGDVYSLSVPISSGGVYASGLSGTSTYILTDTAKALFSGENQAVSGNAPLNLSGLTALAMQTASDFYAGQVAVALDEVYPGTFNWQPDGIHDLIWTWSERDRVASTRVMKTLWDVDITEYQHGTPPLSGYTNTPRGVGGQTVAQTWRDSNSAVISGTILGSGLVASGGGIVGSGDTEIILSDVSYLPTQNRWRGRINSGLVGDETVLFEGTSGGIPATSGGFRVGVVYRAIDGSLVTSHANGDSITYAGPDVSYGVNLATTEKGQFIAPGVWTSGGITEARIIPQTQTVKVLSASGLMVNGAICFSGIVDSPTTHRSGPPFTNAENVWVTERNSGTIQSGVRYDGQLLGWSRRPESVSGTPSAPIYAVNQNAPPIIWARITAAQGFAYSWVEAEQIPPTAGVFATNTGTDFSDKAGGLSGILNLYERNRWANIPIGMHVQIWPNGTSWLCDFELDHFKATVTGGGGGIYTVLEINAPGTARDVIAVEFNNVIAIPAGTVVQIWVYKSGTTLTYGFEYTPPTTGSYTYIDTTIYNVSIVDIQMGDTVTIVNSVTGAVVNYVWQCFNFGCGWVNLCTCELVPWWCVGGECVQSETEPPGATGGPFTTLTYCAEAVCVDPIGDVEGCAEAPFYWGLVVAGGTEDFEQFNGSWTMISQGDAYWTAIKRGILLTLTLDGNTATLQMYSGDGTQATYTATIGPTCCSPIIFELDEENPPQGDGTPPTLVSLDPISECPGSWWCVDGLCVFAESEPVGATDGPFASEAECSAACAVPWWCVADACVQSVDEPVGATDGPWDTETECVLSSCGAVVVACSPDPIPRTLTVEYSTGEVFTIAYFDNAGTPAWQGASNGTSGETTLPCDPVGTGKGLILRCSGGIWAVDPFASCCGPDGTSPVTPTSTSPFLLECTGIADSACGGTVSFTVTGA